MEKGAASIKIELANGIITVYHGTDGDILLQFPAVEGSWDIIWQGIKTAAKKIKDMNNEEFMSNLMNFSPYGALCQAFIIQALDEYCKIVIAEKDEILKVADKNEKKGKVSIVNQRAWVGIAEDIHARMKEKYQ